MSSDSGDESWGYDGEDDPADAPTDPLRRGFGSGYSVRALRDVDDPDVLEDDGEIRLANPDHNYGEDDDFEEEDWDEELDPLGPEDEVWDGPWLIGRDHEIGWPFDEVDATRLTRYLRVDDADRVRGWLVRLDQVEDFSEIEPSRLVRYWNLLFEFYEARVRVSEAIGSSIYEAAVRSFLGDLSHAIDLLCDALDGAEFKPSTAFRDQLLRNGHSPSGAWMARLLLDHRGNAASIRYGRDWEDPEEADEIYKSRLRKLRSEADDLARRESSSHAHRLLLAASIGCSSELGEVEQVLAAEKLYLDLVEQARSETGAVVESLEFDVITDALFGAYAERMDAMRFLEVVRQYRALPLASDESFIVGLNVHYRIGDMAESEATTVAIELLADAERESGINSERAFQAALTLREVSLRSGDERVVALLDSTWIPRALGASHGWASQQWVELAADRP